MSEHDPMLPGRPIFQTQGVQDIGSVLGGDFAQRSRSS